MTMTFECDVVFEGCDHKITWSALAANVRENGEDFELEKV